MNKPLAIHQMRYSGEYVSKDCPNLNCTGVAGEQRLYGSGMGSSNPPCCVRCRDPWPGFKTPEELLAHYNASAMPSLGEVAASTAAPARSIVEDFSAIARRFKELGLRD